MRERIKKGGIGASGVWIVVRLPLLLVSLYGLRDRVTDWIGTCGYLPSATIFVIYFVSTLPERVLICCAGFGFFGVVLVLARRFLRGAHVCLVTVLAGTVFSFALYSLFPPAAEVSAVAGAVLLTCILVGNALPESVLAGLFGYERLHPLFDGFFVFGVGVTELLFPRPLLVWLFGRAERDVRGRTALQRGLVDWFSIIVPVPLLAVLAIDGESLLPLAQKLHASVAVEQFASGDFNWLELNREATTLYASGHGTDHLLAYSVDVLEAPPRESESAIGEAQAFRYNPFRNELYVYNERSSELLTFDAPSLETRKAVEVPNVSPGDSWIEWDRFSDSIFIVSEAATGEQRGDPFVAVDRETGEIVQRENLDAQNTLLHPDKPYMYMAFWIRTNELLKYDTRAKKIIGRVETDKFTNRMAFDEERNELLLASPLHGCVLRYDADTLRRKGEIKTVFWVRSLAIDVERRLLFCGSLANNKIDVIDLETHSSRAQYYVGPWIRTICLNPQKPVAYVSTKYGLFRIDYGKVIQTKE